MSSSTAAGSSPSPTLDPWTPPPHQSSSSNNIALFAAGSSVLGVIALLIVCAVVRMRMVRRRRRALGLPPVMALRRSAKDDLEEQNPKPEIHEIWALLPDENDGLEDFSLQWKELHPLSSSQILSQPAPPKAREKHNPFENYFASIMELFSVEKMDAALLGSIRKEDPAPEYTKSELIATVFIAMPQPTGYDPMEAISLLPELELGVYHDPTTDAV
ncbi:hypothetical protein M407DRAFT_244772 [Tulasnella calospora MUT 4182]|uniref:Uncharacterized protein n=1 Tax=Tulasnella calospora MUT 4182 TaxID=1051891 RepID=A0A0C3QD18_9AGAM|nr:hypothetical protein M407DRAFT_244772 [Tulasnella calospora MUT 4182]